MIDVKYAKCMISWCYHIHMAGVLQKRENSDVGNAWFFFFFLIINPLVIWYTYNFYKLLQKVLTKNP